MKDGGKASLAVAVVVGSYFYTGRVAKFDHSKERRPAWISRNHHHDPNSPYTTGADGEMINMGSVGIPKKGGITNPGLRLLHLAPHIQQNRKATTHEIPWNAKPTLSSESVISADTLPRQNRQFLPGKSGNLGNLERRSHANT